MNILLVLALLWLPQLSGSGTLNGQMEGGGTASLRYDGDLLHVIVTGPRAGLASLCVGNGSRVRILHASAAVGEAVYELREDRWTLQRGFEWTLRDAPRTGPPTRQQHDEFFATAGWTANPSHTGAPQRSFRIRLTDDVQRLGVTFYATSPPAAISHWPAAMNDDCRAVEVAQGYLPRSAAFSPDGWYRVRGR